MLITGATGFVGGQLTRALLDRGDDVRLLVRRKSRKKSDAFGRLGARIIEGDIRDIGAVADAAVGCEIVFHAAALVRGAWPTADYYANNVDGTDAVIGACERANVHRLIYVSDQCVVCEPWDMAGDETLPYATAPACTYAETKIAAEQLVLDAHTTGRVVATVVRPAWVWGPGDTSTLSTVHRLATLALLGSIANPHATTTTTHIRHLLHGLVLASEHPAAVGDIFCLSDGLAVAPRDFACGLAAACGTKNGVGLGLPPPLDYWWREAAYVLARIAVMNEQPFNPTFINMLRYTRDFSDAKARAALGYTTQTQFAAELSAVGDCVREHGAP